MDIKTLTERDYNALKELLQARLNKQRYYHSLCVMNEAECLANMLGADIDKARFAGLMHDVTKNTPDNVQLKLLRDSGITLTDIEANTEKLHHAMSGMCFLEHELNVEDKDVLDAIRYHTTARAGMTILDKIVYMADFISADRDYHGVDELRDLAHTDFMAAIKFALAYTINELVSNGKCIHPDTFEAWNEIAEQL